MGKQRLIEQVRSRRELPPPAARQAIREAAGVSARRLGAELGVTGMAVRHWERGAREPSPQHLRRYAALLEQLQRESADG